MKSTRRKLYRATRTAGAVLLLMAAALLPAGIAAGEEGEAETMERPNTTLMESYKKAGENNPLYTQRFGADPGVMEYDGRLYVYMTDDILEVDAEGKVKENTYSKIRHINCISSDDLVNWTDHGRIPVAGSGGIARGAVNSWAPCAAHKVIDGKEKFFLYFCNGGNGIGVITADSPTGPWRDELGKLLITRKTPNCASVTWLFDPAVMVDEDGTGYLAFGGGIPQGKQAAPGTARIVRLGEDMMSLDCDPVALDAPWLFEDSGINRIGGKYIYSYCSNFQTKGNDLHLTDGAIQYMVSDDPMGPYTYVGELFPNEGHFFGLYGNNHHSIACLDGEYYLFYHNRPVEKAMKISGNYRSPQADRITVNEDGSLAKVRGTMKGLDQRKPLDPYREVSGATMASQGGSKVQMKDGRTWTHSQTGSWIRIAGVDFGDQASAIRLQAASEAGGTVWIIPGTPDGVPAGKAEIPAGTEETVFTVPAALSGVTDLCFVFEGEVDLFTWQAEK